MTAEDRLQLTCSDNLMPVEKGCLLCPERPEHLRRHVLAEHLPHWFHLEVACLHCRTVLPMAQDRMRHKESEYGAVGGEDFKSTLYCTCDDVICSDYFGS